jgi:transcriptional regulator with XRE-family HTH domain
MSTLAERLEKAMAGPPKVTPAELARACGVKQPSISDWLSGRTKKLEASNALAAAEFLGVRYWWLAAGKGPMRDAELAVTRQENEVGSFHHYETSHERLKSSLMTAAAHLAEQVLAAARDGLVTERGLEALQKSLQAQMKDPVSESGTVNSGPKEPQHARKSAERNERGRRSSG